VAQFLHRFNFYITMDFVTSTKEASDYSVISVWAINNNGDWFWVDGICARQTMAKNLDDLFRLVQKYWPQSVGIEVSGQQNGFIPWIQNEMMNRNIYLSLASDNNSNEPGIRPNTNKLERFNIVVPWFKQGKMYFPIEQKGVGPVAEAIDEMSLASPGGFRSKHDDFIDTISMLASLQTWRPSEDLDVGQATDGIWDLDDDSNDDYAIDSYLV
jgi:predicted phage terminase large subunit-like protein